MKKIKLLDDNIINKIAAGEVIERPSNVVKELVENSIDAGSSIITIEISSGIIRVSDNGFGILSDDVETMFLRHATSKITAAEDLQSLSTFGFRGEAMSSIASVSKLELITKNEAETVGTLIEIDAGTIIKKQSVGAAYGTSVIVRNLFYNVPARLKFLKKESTENSYITDLVQKFALSSPHITFNYILNGKKNQYGGKGLRTAIYQIYGKEYYDASILVDYSSELEGNPVNVTGYTCKPSTYRANRSFGTFFINGRYIKNKLLQSAVEDAYYTKLPIGKFPIYTINLEINPAFVDVNVHPTKLEVRFSEEDDVYNIIKTAVRKTLEEVDIIPEPTLKISVEKSNETDEPLPFVMKTAAPGRKLFESKDVLDEPKPYLKASEPEVYRNVQPVNQVSQEVLDIKEALPHSDNLVFKDYRIVGLFLNTYWAIEQNSELYLIDQHAAHERILYDEFMDAITKGTIHTQPLLRPVAITLAPLEEVAYKENEDYFVKLGFEIQALEQYSYLIRSVPFVFEEGISPDGFLEIIRSLQNRTEGKAVAEKIAMTACKAAVKGGDRLYVAEAQALIRGLNKTDNPYTCPHGRPTIVRLSRYEVEKMFKRVL